MRELLRMKRVYAFIAAVLTVCVFGSVGYAQEGAAGNPG